MTGHFVAFSVRTEMDGKREDVEVHKVRRVDVFVLLRKGQDALKRVSEESLSIGEMQNCQGKGNLKDKFCVAAASYFR
jgi:hypothetical protein